MQENANGMVTLSPSSSPVLTHIFYRCGYSTNKKLQCYAAKLVPQSNNHKKYTVPEIEDIKGRLSGGVFTPASLSNACEHCLYSLRFSNYVKHESISEAYENSRFIV